MHRHYPRILYYIVSIEAMYFNLGTLYEALCNTQYVTCEDLGGYLYLITCLRVRYTCFTENERFLPIGRKPAAKSTGYSGQEIRQLPHIRSIPGRYAGNGRQCCDRLRLWDWPALLPTRIIPSTPDDSDGCCNNPRRFSAIVSAPYLAKTSKWGLYCLGCSESTEEETYFRKQYSENGFVKHIALHGPVLIGDGEDPPTHE